LHCDKHVPHWQSVAGGVAGVATFADMEAD